ncbi:flagellar filament outer layer protein FlaA2 [Leptospira sp. GIMC2001]|uniref:flagellar filament outer layer protein FlaA2 n=1 Tax=Leptospira sp. GIMC2001 TaxID=1513297 RepID=UPI0023491BCF|nr:flagellar filament outer layer protein FlaA [Leptospira sp. GIMC2001]WCL48651.1 endoflagellar filament sheath protein [Leptospira sp. GIMC2001]
MGKITSIIVVLSFVLASNVLLAQAEGGPAPQPASGANNQDEGPLKRIILDDFEESEDWRVKSTTPLGETKTLKMVQRGLIKDVFDDNTVPENGGDKIDQNHFLGVKTYFNVRGFDRVELSPPHEYIIKGKARQVSVWVLGRKYRHTLFAKFRDYKDRTHNVRLGKVDFFGWRKMTATIPGFIPQSTRFALLDKNLHFVSLFVTSDVHEVGGDFYFYVDDLEIRTDRSEAKYPGSEIKDNW